MDRRYWLYPSRRGAGRPKPLRSGTVSRRSSELSGFITRSGAQRSATAINWLGTPSVARRTMFGGVRTDNWTSAATRESSTAISDAELPDPTTSTLRPAYADGSR